MSLLFSRLKYSSIPFVIAGVAFKFAHCQWQSAHVQGVHKKVIIYRDIGICVYRLITYQKGKKKKEGVKHSVSPEESIFGREASSRHLLDNVSTWPSVSPSPP